MSTRGIIAELHAVEQRIVELTSRQTTEVGSGLHAERIAGRLVLAGPRVVRQADVDAVLDEFPWHGCSPTLAAKSSPTYRMER